MILYCDTVVVLQCCAQLGLAAYHHRCRVGKAGQGVWCVLCIICLPSVWFNQVYICHSYRWSGQWSMGPSFGTVPKHGPFGFVFMFRLKGEAPVLDPGCLVRSIDDRVLWPRATKLYTL